VRHKLQLLEERLENCDNFEEYNIKHAIYNAWNNVDRNTIRNCWLKTGILPTSYHTTIINRATKELAVETNEQSTIIQELINRINLSDPLDASGNVNHLQYFPIFVRINVTNAI